MVIITPLNSKIFVCYFSYLIILLAGENNYLFLRFVEFYVPILTYNNMVVNQESVGMIK